MYTDAKPLLVVYREKDETILYQLKKLVDTKDDDVENEKVVGTEDGSVSIVAWSEKVWLDNKKAGNTGDLADKILFIADVKGTNKLIPVIDVKFSKHGVTYGFAGNQALLSINEKAVIKKEDYEAFISDFKKISDSKIVTEKKKLVLKDKKTLFRIGATAVLPWLASTVFGGFLIKDVFGDAALVRTQLLMYGITELYLNDLDAFMKA